MEYVVFKLHLVSQGIGQYAKDFIGGKFGNGSEIDASVWEKIEMFHTDSVMCGLSALALKTNAPNVLRQEALDDYASAKGAKVRKPCWKSRRNCNHVLCSYQRWIREF